MYIYIFRSINLPAVQKAVGKVTGQQQTRSNTETNKDQEVQPDNNSAISDVKQGVTNPMEPEKEVPVNILQVDMMICKSKIIPSAKQAKPFLGPHRQNDRLTLNQMKKPQTQAPEPSDKEQKEIIIEDCQVPVDNTSYANWLLEQGINTNVDVQNRSNADNTEITQIPEQKKDIATKGNVNRLAVLYLFPTAQMTKDYLMQT